MMGNKVTMSEVSKVLIRAASATASDLLFFAFLFLLPAASEASEVVAVSCVSLEKVYSRCSSWNAVLFANSRNN